MAYAQAKSDYTGTVHAPAVKQTFEVMARPTAKTGLVGWLTTVDHKKIGMMYAGFAILFFLIGGFEALMIRTQLIVPNNRFINAQLYNELFTMHGTTMIFLAVMPLNAAFFNLLVPIQVGARSSIAAGVLENTPERLHQWLTNPEYFKPGNKMYHGVGAMQGYLKLDDERQPVKDANGEYVRNITLTEPEIDALVAYLHSLK